MKWTKKSVVQATVILAMMAVVSVLGVLQYRWTGEISATEQTRLKAELGTGVKNFSQEFSYDFERLCESFEVDPEAPAGDAGNPYHPQLHRLEKSNFAPGNGGRLENLEKLGPDGRSHLETFDPTSQRFQKAVFSPRLEPLHEFLKKQVDEMLFYEDDRDAMYFPWTIYEDMPALIRPLYQISPKSNDTGMEIEPIGILIVELSPKFLTETYLPELADRSFGNPEQRTFGVIVRSARMPYRTIYPSGQSTPILIGLPRRYRQPFRFGWGGSQAARASPIAGQQYRPAMAIARSASSRVASSGRGGVAASKSCHQSGTSGGAGREHGPHIFSRASRGLAGQDADGIRGWCFA